MRHYHTKEIVTLHTTALAFKKATPHTYTENIIYQNGYHLRHSNAVWRCTRYSTGIRPSSHIRHFKNIQAQGQHAP